MNPERFFIPSYMEMRNVPMIGSAMRMTNSVPRSMGLFSKIKAGLQKTRASISDGITSIINSFTKIDEDLFKSTVMVEQGESRLDKSTQNTLIQKITNLISTGADNISYKKAIDKINKKLLEEVKETAKKVITFETIYLYTEHVGLYEKFGWTYVSEIDTYVKKPRMQRLYKLDIN